MTYFPSSLAARYKSGPVPGIRVEVFPDLEDSTMAAPPATLLTTLLFAGVRSELIFSVKLLRFTVMSLA